jgi:hypothetical protein
VDGGAASPPGVAGVATCSAASACGNRRTPKLARVLVPGVGQGSVSCCSALEAATAPLAGVAFSPRGRQRGDAPRRGSGWPSGASAQGAGARARRRPRACTVLPDSKGQQRPGWRWRRPNTATLSPNAAKLYRSPRGGPHPVAASIPRSLARRSGGSRCSLAGGDTSPRRLKARHGRWRRLPTTAHGKPVTVVIPFFLGKP